MNNFENEFFKIILLTYLMSSTQEIIKSVYYDRSGYGSKQTTLKDAKQKIVVLQLTISMNSLVRM